MKVSHIKQLLKILSPARVFSSIRWVSDICLLGMILLITFEVIGRRFFGFSTLIADEYSAYLLVAVIGLGLADTLAIGAHISIDVVTSRLDPLVRSILALATNFLEFGFATLLAWQCVSLVITSYNSKIISLTIVRTPIYIPQVPLAIGLVLLAFRLLQEIFQNLSNIRKVIKIR